MFAHDHTVHYFPPIKHNNLHFIKTGIGASNTIDAWRKVKTLDTILRENGHSESVINYLKVRYMSSISLIS